MAYGYSVTPEPATTAKASGRHVPVKPKFVREVCAAIRHMRFAQAVTFLEDVIALKRAVPFRHYARNVVHRKGGIGPGRYPVNAAAAVLAILKNAENNAEYKGLEPDTMFVTHAAGHKGRVLAGFMPRAQGRATPWNKATSHIEIVLGEKKRRGYQSAPAADAGSADAADESKKPAAPKKGATKAAAKAGAAKRKKAAKAATSVKKGE